MTVTDRSTCDTADRSSSVNEKDQIGWFRFTFDIERWEWSDEVYRIHGYDSTTLHSADQAGRAPLTTEWVLAHTHPEDRDQLTDKIFSSRHSLETLRFRHRLVDPSGEKRDVTLIARPIQDDAGTVIGIEGFYLDCMGLEVVAQERITAEVEKISQSREAIDQAKGMLMAIYGLNGEAAFRVLRGWSQKSNTRLHTLAEQLIVDFTELGTRTELPSRAAYHDVITNIRERCQQSKPGR